MKTETKTKAVERKHFPGHWQLHIDRWRDGRLDGQPYIYAPNGPDTYRHVAELCIDAAAPLEIQEQQEANGVLLAKAPDLLAQVTALEAELIEQRRVADNQWRAVITQRDDAQADNARLREALADIARSNEQPETVNQTMASLQERTARVARAALALAQR